MTKKQLSIYLSFLALVPIAGAVLFTSHNKNSLLNAEAKENDTLYSMTLSSYIGIGSYQTYNTKNGNPIKFYFVNCEKPSTGFIKVMTDSYIECKTPVHGIKSIYIAANNALEGVGYECSIHHESGAPTPYTGTFNTTLNINVASSVGFSVAFISDYVLTVTSLTFTYSCI